MNRRKFLKGIAGAACATGAWMTQSPLQPRFQVANAQTGGNGKSAIIVFQRGGCDGLNVVVPYGEDEYYNLRQDIAIPAPAAGNPVSSLALNGSDFFGLHPEMAAMRTLFNNGDLALFPTAHYDDASRSHFSGQDWIESGISEDGYDGWLNRHLVTAPVTAELRAVGIGGALPKSLRGDEIVSTFNRLSSFSLDLPPDEEVFVLERLASVYSQVPDASRAYRQLVQDFGRVVVSDLAVISELDINGYVPANGAVYPNSSFGRQMRETAILIKAGVGLEIAALSIGGWDNHSNQGAGEAGGEQARRLTDFSESIAAFYQDMGDRQDDIMVVSMTEFGRTANMNGSFGTDHGNAATWCALGGNVIGGIYGDWPGLLVDQLYRERYLQHTVDYRNILAEVMFRHLGNDVANLDVLLPGHTYEPLGFLPATA